MISLKQKISEINGYKSTFQQQKINKKKIKPSKMGGGNMSQFKTKTRQKWGKKIFKNAMVIWIAVLSLLNMKAKLCLICRHLK